MAKASDQGHSIELYYHMLYIGTISTAALY
jgi:hypothetical protein